MGDLLLDRDAQVGERRVAEAVEVEQEVVEVEPLGAVEGARAAGSLADPGRDRGVPVERLGVVLVIGTVVLPAVGPDQRRVEMADGVVRLRGVPRGRRGRAVEGGAGVELPLEVGVDRLTGVLELADRLARDVLDDRLEAPARAAARRGRLGRPVRHDPEPASPAL
jgi:hypothetical protein